MGAFYSFGFHGMEHGPALLRGPPIGTNKVVKIPRGTCFCFFVVRRSVCVLVAFQFVLVCVLVSRHRKRKNLFFRFVVFVVGNRKTGQCKTPTPCEDCLPLKGR